MPSTITVKTPSIGKISIILARTLKPTSTSTPIVILLRLALVIIIIKIWTIVTIEPTSMRLLTLAYLAKFHWYDFIVGRLYVCELPYQNLAAGIFSRHSQRHRLI